MAQTTRDANRRPTHPGAILRFDVLPALGISQEQFARRLGVSRLTVSQLLHEHRSLSASMAVRLERELGTSAERWLAMQQAVDLWEARREATKTERRFVGEVVSKAAAATFATLIAGEVIERARISSTITASTSFFDPVTELVDPLLAAHLASLQGNRHQPSLNTASTAARIAEFEPSRRPSKARAAREMPSSGTTAQNLT